MKRGDYFASDEVVLLCWQNEIFNEIKTLLSSGKLLREVSKGVFVT